IFLQLKGRILNVGGARFDRMLSSKEIGTMIQALGTSIGRDEFNIENLRYHKIIIMTDPHAERAHPPYKFPRGRSEFYPKDDAALDEYLVDPGLDGLVLEGVEQRSGKDLRTLVDHARRMRTLRRYAPRNY